MSLQSDDLQSGPPDGQSFSLAPFICRPREAAEGWRHRAVRLRDQIAGRGARSHNPQTVLQLRSSAGLAAISHESSDHNGPHLAAVPHPPPGPGVSQPALLGIASKNATSLSLIGDINDAAGAACGRGHHSGAVLRGGMPPPHPAHQGARPPCPTSSSTCLRCRFFCSHGSH